MKTVAGRPSPRQHQWLPGNQARRVQTAGHLSAGNAVAAGRHTVAPMLPYLHIDYKLATLVYKSLRGQAPSYLVDDCQLIVDSGRPQIRSAHANVLTVPRRNTRLDDRSFSVAGPRIWNSLPASLLQPDTEFGQFKRLLKAFLFGKTMAH